MTSITRFILKIRLFFSTFFMRTKIREEKGFIYDLRGEEFTAKDGNKARKDEIKRIKQESKDIRRSSRLNAKANRIKSRI